MPFAACTRGLPVGRTCLCRRTRDCPNPCSRGRLQGLLLIVDWCTCHELPPTCFLGQTVMLAAGSFTSAGHGIPQIHTVVDATKDCLLMSTAACVMNYHQLRFGPHCEHVCRILHQCKTRDRQSPSQWRTPSRTALLCRLLSMSSRFWRPICWRAWLKTFRYV